MIIRDAKKDDIPRLLELMGDFYAASGYEFIAPFDDESVKRVFCSLIDGCESILLVSLKDGVIIGFIGATIVPFFINNAIRICQELFWWVDPGNRGEGVQMLSELEGRAIALGAHILAMTSVDAIKPKAIQHLYQRYGFRLSEHGFTKDLR